MGVRSSDVEEAVRQGKMVVLKSDTPLRVEGPDDKVKVIVRSRG